MKKLSLFSLFVTAILLLSACGSSFDEDGFSKVRDYADEMIVAVESAYHDVMAGNEDTYQEHADRLDDINTRHWTDDFPGDDMQDWLINMSQGGNEWTINGKELHAAVFDLEFNSDWLAQELRENGYIERAAKEAYETAVQLRQVIYNQ